MGTGDEILIWNGPGPGADTLDSINWVKDSGNWLEAMQMGNEGSGTEMKNGLKPKNTEG
jgi:hypothetical protein